MDSGLNTKTRFSSRVSDYIKYRPKYPSEIINFLKKEIDLDSSQIIADIGSGTGFLSELFLRNGNKVIGIEPNKEMREAGEEYLQYHKNFRSINGSAESTNLESNSVDIITAGQAYHWFHPSEAKKEFLRVLKNYESANCILIWNARDIKLSEIGKKLEDLTKKYSVDYEKVRQDNTKSNISTLGDYFFNKDFFKRKDFSNQQNLNLEGLIGRFVSSSYIIEKDNPRYNKLIEELEFTFNRFEENGKITLLYNTEVFYGKLIV